MFPTTRGILACSPDRLFMIIVSVCQVKLYVDQTVLMTYVKITIPEETANRSRYSLFLRATVKKEWTKTVSIKTFPFLNQTLWCDPHWNRLIGISETISTSGNTIWFGWEIRKLVFWKLSILYLICCLVSLVQGMSAMTVDSDDDGSADEGKAMFLLPSRSASIIPYSTGHY